MTVKVLFVCLGNICRSPTAHGLFEDKVKAAGLSDKIVVDSAGTGDWHVGGAPDKRAQATALERGYDISQLKARQVTSEDYQTFDYILGMDEQNVLDLKRIKTPDYRGVLGLFLEVANVGQGEEVPDPYLGGNEHFNNVIDLVEQGSDGLLERIKKEHKL